MSEKLNSWNPATEELLGSVEITPLESIPSMTQKSKSAQKKWALLSVDERIGYLKEIGVKIEQKKEDLAVLLGKEMGKDLDRAMGEVSGCAHDISYKSTEIKKAIEVQRFISYGVQTELQYNALGVCAVIAPWNYPMAMAHWLMVPALIAGNSVLFKPSEETPLIAQAYFEILQEVLPKDVVQIIHGDERQGKALVLEDINLIAFTGSKEAGQHIMQSAASGLKRLILELGGKDPLLVLEDANIIQAAGYAVGSSFENAGQMCTSIERIYVDEKILDVFEQRVVEYARQYKLGTWDDPHANIGPIINKKQRNKIIEQIEDAKLKGAKVLIGGENHPNGFVTPTVLSNVTEDMLVFQEETFGPVVAISSFENVNEAISRANNSEFALGASIFGHKDVDKLSVELDAGMLGINQGSGSLGDTPWVGAKQSGYGYHGSADGHRQFTQAKVVTKRQQ